MLIEEQFNSIFSGYSSAFGIFEITNTAQVKQTGRARTVKGSVTLDLWKSHLGGKNGIGIVPLRDDNSLMFGVIDVDDYSIELSDLNREIQESNLPLISFRSKSGGAHLYLFLKEPIQASKVRPALESMASLLGFPKAEIFPKQDNRPDPDSVGNWINMPYFNGEHTERYALDEDGNAIPIDKVINFIESKTVDESAVLHYVTEETTRAEKMEPLQGGPPCLNTLLIRGLPPNTRNNSLFNLGVYAKKSSPDSWEQLVEVYNRDFIDPPLDHKEVGAIIKSLSVKDYNYKCKDSPIVSVCNKSKCMVCRFGIRPDQEIPKLGKLRKVLTDPPIWQVDVVNGGTLELSTEELQQPRLFQKKCMDVLNVMPPTVKGDQWREIVSGLLENLVVVEVPKESSPRGRLIEHLFEFLEGRVQAKQREDILTGRPYLNNETHYFRMRDFQKYLENIKFTDIKQNKIISTIKSIESVSHIFWNIQGRGTNLWSIPERDKVED